VLIIAYSGEAFLLVFHARISLFFLLTERKTPTAVMAQTCLPPGFRFHPTDVELVSYYLKRKIMGKKLFVEAISVVELYKFAPWDLPGNSLLMLFFLRCNYTNMN
jgi:hypothetical protein